MKSYLYVISNNMNPGMVKIGISEEHPDAIVRFLDSTGAAPILFKLDYKVFLNDAFPILQNLRRELWALLKNVGQGWFYIEAEEAITMVRHQIASTIVVKYRQEVQAGYEENEFEKMLRAIDSTLPITGDNTLSRINDLPEAMEVSKHIVSIIKSEGLIKKDRWLSIVSNKNR